MPSQDPGAIVFARLRDVDPRLLIDLMNDPAVRRHLPLAEGEFGPEDCQRFVDEKERMWESHGYGPWAFFIDGEFAGWGGLQPEGDEVDVGLVLHPKHWGAGLRLYRRILAFAFDTLGVESVIALLPPSRTRLGALERLGFAPDGEIDLTGQRFLRFRLHSSTHQRHVG